MTPPGGTGPMDAAAKRRKLMLYGFIATAAVTVASAVTGVVLSISARDKAQEMANAGVNGPVHVFDGEVEKIQKQGKALDTGAVFCYVLAGLAAGATGYLMYEAFFKGKKEKPKKRVWRITPSVGPTSWGLSGQFEF